MCTILLYNLFYLKQKSNLELFNIKEQYTLGVVAARNGRGSSAALPGWLGLFVLVSGVGVTWGETGRHRPHLWPDTQSQTPTNQKTILNSNLCISKVKNYVQLPKLDRLHKVDIFATFLLFLHILAQ